MKILVLDDNAQEYGDYLDHLPDDITYARTLSAAADQYDVMLAQPDLAASFLVSGGRVGWIQSTWAGIKPLADLPLDNRCVITGVKDIFGAQMAEYVFSYILQEIRSPERYRQQQSEKSWRPILPGTLSRRRMTIIGTGSIGQHIAHVAQAFGIEVFGVSKSGKSVPGFAAVVPLSELNTVVSNADYVVMVLPDTPSTENALNAEVFAAMESKPLLFNVGRANSIAQEALLEALHEGTVRGAILDVFDTEPLPPTHPFWDAPNVTITPHVAAVSYPSEIAQIFLENLERYRSGGSLNYVMDLKRGY